MLVLFVINKDLMGTRGYIIFISTSPWNGSTANHHQDRRLLYGCVLYDDQTPVQTCVFEPLHFAVPQAQQFRASVVWQSGSKVRQTAGFVVPTPLHNSTETHEPLILH